MMLSLRLRGSQARWTRFNTFRQRQRGKARQPVRADVIARTCMRQGRRQMLLDRPVGRALEFAGQLALQGAPAPRP